MKSPKEIKLEIERQTELRKLREFDSLLEWIEMCITRQISANQNGIRIFENDHNIGEYFYKIKPILENKGYIIKKVEDVHRKKIIFGRVLVYTENFIEIEWD